MKKRHLWIAAMILAIAVAFSAFAYAEDEIKVGAVQPITGRFAFAGVNINAGLEDALMIANEEGGINGKKIKYIMEDGQYQLDVAVSGVQTNHVPGQSTDHVWREHGPWQSHVSGNQGPIQDSLQLDIFFR